MSAVLSPPDLSIEDCARITGMSSSTIKRDIAEGKLVATKYRGGTRIAVADFEEYRKKCRASTVPAGRLGFSMPGVGLAKRLGLTETPKSTKGASDNGSKIIELDGRRPTRLKKL